MAKADIGHNSDTELKEAMIEHVKDAKEIAKIATRQNVRLNGLKKARGDDFSKVAFRQSAKDLLKDGKGRRAQLSIAAERERYYELCKDLPLFSHAAKNQDTKLVGKKHAA